MFIFTVWARIECTETITA